MSCLVSKTSFKERYKKLGYVVQDGKADSLQRAMDEYTSEAKWAKYFKLAQQMDTAQTKYGTSTHLGPDIPTEKPKR